MQANYVQRLRLIFSKSGAARFIGHLDLARSLERALNRAQIPLAYTQGFNPRPRMQMAAALPLGFTSECEIADIWLLERINVAEAKDKIMSRMAPGITVHSVGEIDLSEPALQTLTTEATYVVCFPDGVDTRALQERIETLLAAESIERERRGKVYDLRPLILDLTVTSGANQVSELILNLTLLPGKSGRPDEVLIALGLDPLDYRIHRTQIVLADEPIPQS